MVLDKIDNNVEGVLPMRLPNVYLTPHESRTLELEKYISSSGGYSFQVEDTSVVVASLEANQLVLTGQKTGTTKVTVSTNTGASQVFAVIVRNKENPSWL